MSLWLCQMTNGSSVEKQCEEGGEPAAGNVGPLTSGHSCASCFYLALVQAHVGRARGPGPTISALGKKKETDWGLCLTRKIQESHLYQGDRK